LSSKKGGNGKQLESDESGKNVKSNRYQTEKMEEYRKQQVFAARADPGGVGGAEAKPRSTSSTSYLSAERNGLCVICQDEDANIAIVDCGYVHLPTSN
jgi:hypothetical protein